MDFLGITFVTLLLFWYTLFITIPLHVIASKEITSFRYRHLTTLDIMISDIVISSFHSDIVRKGYFEYFQFQIPHFGAFWNINVQYSPTILFTNKKII